MIREIKEVIKEIKYEIVELTETGILVSCVAMYLLKVFGGLNISWWFILPPMIIIVLCVVTMAYIKD